MDENVFAILPLYKSEAFCGVNHFTVPVSFMFPLLHLTMVSSSLGSRRGCARSRPRHLAAPRPEPSRGPSEPLHYTRVRARIQVGGVCHPPCSPKWTFAVWVFQHRLSHVPLGRRRLIVLLRAALAVLTPRAFHGPRRMQPLRTRRVPQSGLRSEPRT